MADNKPSPRWGLREKVILSILVVGAVPLAIGLVMAYLQGTRELRELSGTTFAGIASETARKMESLFRGEVSRGVRIASDPRIVDALEDLSFSAVGPIHGADRGELAGLLKTHLAAQQVGSEPAEGLGGGRATLDLYLTDPLGNLLAATAPGAPDPIAEQAWRSDPGPAEAGQARFGNLHYDEARGLHVFTMSLPVMDRSGGRVTGILHRLFDAKAYLDPAISPIRFGETGHVMLINGEGVVLSCPILPTGTRLTDPDLTRMVAGSPGGWVNSPSDGHGSRTASIVGFASLGINGVLGERSPADSWSTFVWQSSSELFAPMESLFRWIILFALVGTVFLALLGYATAARIVRPIRQLQAGAALIGEGRLREPIMVRTGDEIEQLADAFNRMHAQLQQAFSGLRSKVQEQRQEVKYLQAYTEQVLQSIPLPIFILDREERVEYANRAAIESLKLRLNETPGGRLFDLIPISKKSREAVRQEMQAILRARETGERTAGTGATANVQAAFRPDVARREVKINGTTYQYQCFFVPGRPEEPERIGLVLRDTTQESRVQDQMIQSERLASLDILTSGIGHELNNPLHGIIGLCEAILDEQQTPQIKEYAKRILEHTRRMAGIIQDFSGYRQGEESDLYVRMDLNQCLDKALQVAGVLNGKKGVELVRSYKPLPKLNLVPEEIVQVFVNLLKNAVQAMNGKGALRITTDAAYGAITVKISDSGPGIPKSHVSKIFDPFFTTKGPGQGTGLGLTVVRRVMAKYNAQVRVESEEKEGTSFVLIFPI